MNPDVEFNIVWAYTWFDPAKEADAANALIEQDCDVVLQHRLNSTSGSGKAGNVITFGRASDMAEFIFSARFIYRYDWGPYYVARTQAVLDGTWTSMDTWDGIGPGMVSGEISSAVPTDIKAEAEALRDALGSGEYHAFTGPLNKQEQCWRW